MKVYCKNCKYYEPSSFLEFIGYISDDCNAPTGKIITNYITGDYKERVNKSSFQKGYPNNAKTNGCKYYKRKWYKFWVKVR